ncbi:MAG: hypothetical protein DMD36_11170 [Gemmatimonadetes bacterium]|nr:MAG: hypothetical protein DMD36_11170 [Gemmatimonadota bacterium]
MSITRRRFLGCAAGAVTMGLPFDLRRFGRSSLSPETSPRWVLLDLKEHGCLGEESVSGFECALDSLGAGGAGGARLMRAEARWVSRCAVLVIPAALEIPPPAVRAIVSCLQAGASVILESGAGFADGRDFRGHRDVLRDYLQVRIGAPVPLWSAHIGSQRIPYVDYTWPSPAKVRDFSRVVPLGRQSGEVIARVDGLPVALKRQTGRGRLIFLGSPLGPALWAGDVEARRWLFDCLGESGGCADPRSRDDDIVHRTLYESRSPLSPLTGR